MTPTNVGEMTHTSYSRRDVLKRGAFVAAAGAALPIIGRVGAAVGLTSPDPSTALRNRLVVIYLGGGNDGLNTVVPKADVAGAHRRSVYDQIRGGIGYAPRALLPLDRGEDADAALGLNPKLPNLHKLYRDGRVAIVQGVAYPNQDFSHFTSTAIWQSGQPDKAPDSGWLGRHLDRTGIGEGELRGLAIGRNLPLTMQGRDDKGTNIDRVPLRFADGGGAVYSARHRALQDYLAHVDGEPLRQVAATNAAYTSQLVEHLAAEPAPPSTGNQLANALLTARLFLEGNYGCEVVHVQLDGFDTHAAQRSFHEGRLTDLDRAINTFLNGDAAQGVAPLDPDVASRTLIMTYSEFGRRIGQNGSGGTDHGAAAPLFLIGPAGGRLVGGLHGEHPDMGTTLLPADNLEMTTSLRSVYQTVLDQWLGNPQPDYASTLPGIFA